MLIFNSFDGSFLVETCSVTRSDVKYTWELPTVGKTKTLCELSTIKGQFCFKLLKSQQGMNA